jgi:hypothetical protein
MTFRHNTVRNLCAWACFAFFLDTYNNGNYPGGPQHCGS